jgi:hypothetical protein
MKASEEKKAQLTWRSVSTSGSWLTGMFTVAFPNGFLGRAPE